MLLNLVTIFVGHCGVDMDELLAILGQIFFAAFALGVGVEMLKQFPLKKYQENEYFSLVIWLVTIAGGFLLTWIFQGLEWIIPGWRVTVIAGLFVAGLAMMGYEGVKIIWLRIRGDSTGRDTVNIRDVHGENIDIGGN